MKINQRDLRGSRMSQPSPAFTPISMSINKVQQGQNRTLEKGIRTDLATPGSVLDDFDLFQ